MRLFSPSFRPLGVQAGRPYLEETKSGKDEKKRSCQISDLDR